MAMVTTDSLLDRKCVPCEGGEAPLTPAEVNGYLQQLITEWEVEDNRRIKREFEFNSFADAMVFVNDVAAIAEREGHHPDMYIYFKKVVIELTTHAINGLSENDFILARKIEVCC